MACRHRFFWGAFGLCLLKLFLRYFLFLSVSSLSDDTAMRSSLIFCAVFFGACGAAHALDAAAAVDLAKANGCYSCHAAAEKVVGPAFVSIADKYKDDKDAVTSWVQSIQYGSKGKWGRIPMPAYPSMSVGDIKTLAQWVMATKP